jgi:hypothetical protein
LVHSEGRQRNCAAGGSIDPNSLPISSSSSFRWYRFSDQDRLLDSLRDFFVVRLDIELVWRWSVRSPVFAASTIGTLTVGLGMFAFVLVGLLAVNMAPCYVPARRVLNIDPSQMLHQ